jgi:hypothetical protein
MKKVFDFVGLSVDEHPIYMAKAQWWNIENWNPKWRNSEHLTQNFNVRFMS